MTDADDLILRARRTAIELNYVLDLLTKHEVECLDVRSHNFQDPGLREGRRVELILQFQAKKPAA